MRQIGVVAAMLAASWATPTAAQRFIPLGEASARGVASDYWRDKRDIRLPGQSEIEKAREALRRYFAMPPQRAVHDAAYWNEASRQVIARTLDDYTVQVASVSVYPIEMLASGESRREILMQGVCSASAKDMRLDTALFTVADGGDCFFYMHYDPVADKVTRFYAGGN